MVLTREATGGNRQFNNKTYDLWEKVFADLQQVRNLTGLADNAADAMPPIEVLKVSALFISLSLCLYMYIYLSIYLSRCWNASCANASFSCAAPCSSGA